MTAPTEPTAQRMHELLEQMLTGDPIERSRAWLQLLRDGCGELTVIDEACERNGRFLALRVLSLSRHLQRHDQAGDHKHTPANTYLGSVEEERCYGPALSRRAP